MKNPLSKESPRSDVNIYETPRLVAEYLLFHYGKDEDVLPWDFGPKTALRFAQRSVNELLDPSLVPADACVLDLGCAVGRSCYELARVASRVIGIDYSQAFVDYAERIRTGVCVPFLRLNETTDETMLDAVRPAEGSAERIQFEQGDAMHLRGDLGAFDIVHAANLLCRLTDPQLLIERLPALVKPGGQLLLTTPCTWLEDFTPRGNWPDVSTREWLKIQLSEHFDLVAEKDLPFLIREHARKYQWSVALGTRWIRKTAA